MRADLFLDGSQLSALWGLPFAGLLLSIALLPLLAPGFWHHHYGKVAAAWALAFFLPFAAIYGAGLAAFSFMHALLDEYIPFILLLTALFTAPMRSASSAATRKVSADLSISVRASRTGFPFSALRSDARSSPRSAIRTDTRRRIAERSKGACERNTS